MTSSSSSHSLLSLGNLVQGISDVISEIKYDVQQLKSGGDKIELLEQNVQFLAAKIERAFTGTPNPFAAGAASDSPSTTTTSSSSSHPRDFVCQRPKVIFFYSSSGTSAPTDKSLLW